MAPKFVLWGIYPREMKLLSHKILEANVHRSFISNSAHLETTQMPFNTRMIKQTVYHYGSSMAWVKRRTHNKKKDLLLQ